MILQTPRASEIGQNRSLSLQDFLNLPDDGRTYELVDGEAIPKMSPKKFHARLTRVLLNLLTDWAVDKGETFPELAIALKRNGKSWVPVPDLLYLSRERFPEDWEEDGTWSPQTFTGGISLADVLLPGLKILPETFFQQAKI